MIEKTFTKDSYSGECCVCGTDQVFTRCSHRTRETYKCIKCSASLRERGQAEAILYCYGKNGNIKSLNELIHTESFKKLTIYEPGTIGPFRQLLRTLPYYFESDFYSEENKHKSSAKLPHQNLESLTYSDNKFDLVITSDIMEHVRKPKNAFLEIFRVLKSGGNYIFTVPLQNKTIQRVNVESDIDIPILEECYHGNGKNGRSLVYNDFGLDIKDLLDNIGFITSLKEINSLKHKNNYIYTIIASKPN